MNKSIGGEFVMKKEKFTVAVDIGWIEDVVASSMQEAIKLTEKKYKWGKGRIPREYVEVSDSLVYGEDE